MRLPLASRMHWTPSENKKAQGECPGLIQLEPVWGRFLPRLLIDALQVCEGPPEGQEFDVVFQIPFLLTPWPEQQAFGKVSFEPFHLLAFFRWILGVHCGQEDPHPAFLLTCTSNS